MTYIRFFVGAVAMLWLNAFAFDPEVDLNGSVVIADGQCPYKGRLHRCFMMVNGDSIFIVAVDMNGVLAVSTVKEIKGEYSDGEVKLIWERGQNVVAPQTGNHKEWKDGA